MIFRFFRWRPWMRIPLLILGLIGLLVAIWIGLPMIGWPIFGTVWLRAVLTAVIIGPIIVMQILGWRKRRRAAREIEEALTPPEPEGDGKVLAERMNGALATLKKSGGSAYLYDLPWYVIIGPPGAGKTTALRNSGIEFPLSNADDAGVVSGFGGTRYCDWWFAEDAILIDTAGRYTTQDSDKTADESSWQSFLDLLKRSRPNQPINGVILAFSVEDMMRATPEELARHSEIVRARLGEVHEKLRIDFPVYVLFTKCDLISGFREYFSSFSLSRRKAVWGVTFQTKDRKAQTHEQVPDEFDRLVSRLSDEIIDRLTEEPDGISRVAIFGLPGQMALLRDNVTDFLRRVFEPTRYKTSAILRGFYFTSGTQEGTPIDQVLGAMSGNDAAPGAFAPAFMSGQGKSFFLHDLLRRVIFEERDWVSHDVRAVRRTQIGRAVGLSLIGVTTAALLGAFGFSFWQNRLLVQDLNAEVSKYAIDAQVELARTEIDAWDPLPVLPHLERVRLMPASLGNPVEKTFWTGFGLRQTGRFEAATRASYADALEQMLRPRLILDVERRLPDIRNAGDPAQIYRALKVYMLLAGQGPRPDDDAIKAWFAEIWDATYSGVGAFDEREQLKTHLTNMLELDDTRNIAIPIDSSAVTLARSAIVQMSLADQAYAIIQDKAKQSSLPPFSLARETAPETSIVFSTSDGSDIADVTVPALYTFDGYWFFFLEQVIDASAALESDKWVLGEQAEAANYSAQLRGLDKALHVKYARDFEAAWNAMFARVELNNMSADSPNFDVLATASAPFASPIYRFANAVSRETKLTVFLDELANVDPAELMAGDVGSNVGSQMLGRVRSSSGGLQRILFDAVSSSAKNQQQVGGSGGGDSDGDPRREAERIEERFARWHQLVEGPAGQSGLDVLLADLAEIRNNRRLAERFPDQQNLLLPGLLTKLTANNSRLPVTIAAFMEEVERDFLTQSTESSIVDMTQDLRDNVSAFCTERIEGYFPFRNNGAHVGMDDFERFFGPDGLMDRFYQDHLIAHVRATSGGLVIDQNSPLSDRLSGNMLLQFERAQHIQRAFFPGGSQRAEVQITFTPIDIQSGIKILRLDINGTQIELEQGGRSDSVIWPGRGSSTVLRTLNGVQALTRGDGDIAGQWRGGQWTIIPFIREAGSSQAFANGMRLTYSLRGRSAMFDMEFQSAVNPFTMPELQNFSCPQGVE